MNIEELFTLSGTGLVIGALLSWLSLAFTARRIPASAAQTQPNSRQPLSSGGKALRVFSLAAAKLAAFAVLIFTYVGVNIFFAGLHSYAALEVSP